MKITINTSAENIEMANFLLGQAYKSAIQNDQFKKDFKVTNKQLLKAEKFRESLLDAFLKTKPPTAKAEGENNCQTR